MSSRGGAGEREGAVVDGNGCRHDALAVRGGAIEVMTRDLGYQAMATELGDLSAHVGTTAFGLDLVSRRVSPQAALYVGVGEPDDGVLTGEMACSPASTALNSAKSLGSTGLSRGCRRPWLRRGRHSRS